MAEHFAAFDERIGENVSYELVSTYMKGRETNTMKVYNSSYKKLKVFFVVFYNGIENYSTWSDD